MTADSDVGIDENDSAALGTTSEATGEHADPGTHRHRLQPRGATAPVGQGQRPGDEIHPQRA